VTADVSDGALVVDVRVGDRLDVAFRAPPGFTVLLGPSGAGKTTTLLAVAGLVRVTSGTVRLGADVLVEGDRQLPPERRRLGMVFQSLALFPHLTGRQNVAYGVAGSRDQRRAAADAWLERLRVAHVADRKPATVSGGEGQRVALARALAMRPRALLLDEPFSALDDAMRAALRDDLARLVHDARLPTLFVTHDARDAQALAQQTIVLSNGRVAQRALSSADSSSAADTGAPAAAR
jgi:ABC-type sulfate/molybdate transport systems ATPase subunit